MNIQEKLNEGKKILIFPQTEGNLVLILPKETEIETLDQIWQINHLIQIEANCYEIQ